jgi:hypothetical protein
MGDRAAGCGAEAATFERLNPQEAQNLNAVELTWLHWGHVTVSPLGGVDGSGARGIGAGDDIGAGSGCAGSTPDEGRRIGAEPPAVAGGAAGEGTDTGRIAAAAFIPCGGVRGANGLGAASRGSSAPQPRQNL